MTFIIIEIKGFKRFFVWTMNQPSYLPSIDPEQILNSSVKERTTYTRKTMVNLRDSANSVKALGKEITFW